MDPTTTSNTTTYGDYGIHIGTWTNWSHGPVFGGTLTLTKRDGAFFIAFIALFVTLVGTSFWRISCYAIHHLYSSEAARDGLHHQRQAILRNSANGASGFASFCQVLWAWRHDTHHPYRRTLPILFYTVLTISLFSVAGIFSSKISSMTGNEVLVKSSHCATLNPDVDNKLPVLLHDWFPYRTHRVLAWRNYAEQCYRKSSDQEFCKVYVKTRLPYKTDRNASCPFRDGVCRSASQNLLLDTGYLDSLHDLGLNTPPTERFLWRQMTRCAPLVTKPYEQHINVSYHKTDVVRPYTRYYYGERGDIQLFMNENYTYTYPSRIRETVVAENYASDNQDYTLSTLTAWAENGSYKDSSGFQPIPALRVRGADTFIAFLSANLVVSITEVDDAWYSAHQKLDPIVSSAGTIEGSSVTYGTDALVNVLGCSLQQQFCDPNSPQGSRCSPWLGRGELDIPGRTVWKDANKYERLQWMWRAFDFSMVDFSSITGSLGISALTARNSLSNGFQGALPNYQWQLEVKSWYNIALSSLQAGFVEAATGPADPNVYKFLLGPSNEDERKLCKNQKIISTAYTNFSIFGICIIFGIGGLLIILSYTLEPLISWIQKRHNLDVYTRLEWSTNETLQLQRLAHEELGVGTWKRCADAVPITERGQRLAMLDLEDVQHPKLKVPPVAFDDLFARSSVEETKAVAAAESASSMSDQAGSNTAVRPGDEPPLRCSPVNQRAGAPSPPSSANSSDAGTTRMPIIEPVSPLQPDDMQEQERFVGL